MCTQSVPLALSFLVYNTPLMEIDILHFDIA